MAAPRFSATIRRRPPVVIIDLHGDMDGASDEALTTAYTATEHDAPDTIVINFTDVGYINSTGIALIVGLLARARTTGRRLLVFGLSDHYEEIFKITRLSDFMDMYPDEASALSSITEEMTAPDLPIGG